MYVRFQTCRLAVALAVALLASSLLVPHLNALAHAETATQVAVTASALNVRAGPGTHSRILTQARKDTPLTVQKKHGNWLFVRLPKGLTGWVYGRYVRPLTAALHVKAAPSSKTVTVTASSLNVRSGPGTHYAILTKAKRNTRLTVQKQHGNWLLVRLLSGLTGWVSGQYVRPVGAITATALAWPVPSAHGVSSGFGYRTHPITGKRRLHNGIDIPAPEGTPIVAAEDGEVIVAGSINGYGNTVILDHGGGLWTLYGHIKEGGILVRVGQQVRRGQTIALVGATGTATNPHLHFTVYKYQQAVNPWPYLQ